METYRSNTIRRRGLSLLCAADNIEHNKYHDCKQSYYHIRKLSDELYKAHNLSIIIPGGERGKKSKEWQSDQNGSTWKTQLRRNINFCIKSASTYEDFLLLMKVKGYEIKMESFNAHSTALWKHTLLHPVFVHRSKAVTGTDTYIISPL